MWFGYTLHLIADATYEIPVAAAVTKASASEVTTLETLLKDVFEDTPDLALRYQDMSAERGYHSTRHPAPQRQTGRLTPVPEPATGDSPVCAKPGPWEPSRTRLQWTASSTQSSSTKTNLRESVPQSP